jgi:hypothetical protein
MGNASPYEHKISLEADGIIREYEAYGSPEAIESIADGLMISLPPLEDPSNVRDLIQTLRQRARAFRRPGVSPVPPEREA